jgi:membrane fusion protein (multidrug efflux system)
MEEGRLNRNGENQSKVRLILEDGTEYAQNGVLQFYDVAVDPTTGSVTLRVVFPNPEGVLLPSMFARAVIREGVSENAILIPQQAVARDIKGNPVVYIVDNENKVQQRTLVLDHAMGDQWLVSSGLKQGDRIIVEGIQKVRPGASVKVIPYQSGPAAQKAN